MFNLAFMGAFGTSVILFLLFILLGYPLKYVLAGLVPIVVVTVIYQFTLHYRKHYLGAFLITVASNFIFCPMAFLAFNAVQGGVSSFFVLSIVFTILMLKGKLMCFTVLLELVNYALLYFYVLHHPQIVLGFQNMVEVYKLSYIFMAMAALLIGISVKVIIVEYGKESTRVKGLLNQVQELSIRDSLTCIYNRRYLMEYLESNMQKSKAERSPLSIILFDIDRFKEINDTYGHVLGDEVLKEISQVFLKNCRKGDIVARYGGEEFVLVLPETNLEIAVRRAEQIRMSVNHDINIAQLKEPVTISGGIAQYFYDYGTKEFIKKADENLYIAKGKGRNQIIG